MCMQSSLYRSLCYTNFAAHKALLTILPVNPAMAILRRLVHLTLNDWIFVVEGVGTEEISDMYIKQYKIFVFVVANTTN